MEQSIYKYLQIIDVIENNYTYINKIPYCEPQLGKRGLYPTLSAQKSTAEFIESMMWLLNLTDGEHDLIDIADISKLPIKSFFDVVDKLKAQNILGIH